MLAVPVGSRMGWCERPAPPAACARGWLGWTERPAAPRRALTSPPSLQGGGLRDSFLVDGVAFKKTFSYAGFEMQPKAYDVSPTPQPAG